MSAALNPGRMPDGAWDAMQQLARLWGIDEDPPPGIGWIQTCQRRLAADEPCRMPTLTAAILADLTKNLSAAYDILDEWTTRGSLLEADRWIAREVERRARKSRRAAARRRQTSMNYGSSSGS